LRWTGVRASNERVRPRMREQNLQAPGRTGHPHGPKAHDVIITALPDTEKTPALMTVEYLEERAKRGSRQDFEAVLGKVPDVKPAESVDCEAGQKRSSSQVV
jgi:hypothetical protein